MSDLPMSTEELIHACVQGERGAWEEFIQRYDRLIVGVVFRTAGCWGVDSDELIKDMVQDVYLKLCEDQCRLLKQFQARHEGSIYGYLKAITANEVHDRFRQLHSAKRGGNQVDTPIELVTKQPVAGRDGSEAQIEQQLLFQEIDALLKSHLPEPTRDRDRTIFWLHHRQGLTSREIALLPSIGLTGKGVESTLCRLEELLRSAMLEGMERAPRDHGEEQPEKGSGQSSTY